MGTEHAWMKSRLGWIHVQGHEAGLTRLAFAEGKPPNGYSRGGALTRPVLERLERYFAGDLHAIDDVAVAPKGTAFQLAVWKELRRIAAGDFISYAELADRIGKPRAVRAVGQANAKNPIALVVPCHRVVASDGSLGGYSAGQERKAWLLEHERVVKLQPRHVAKKNEAPAVAVLPLFEALRAQL